MKTWLAVFGRGNTTVKMEVTSNDFDAATEMAEHLADKLWRSFLYLEQKYTHE